jgi:hypothetical protein
LPEKLREVQYETYSYEADPLICPRCGGPLKIISLIGDGPVLPLPIVAGLPASPSEVITYAPFSTNRNLQGQTRL